VLRFDEKCLSLRRFAFAEEALSFSFDDRFLIELRLVEDYASKPAVMFDVCIVPRSFPSFQVYLSSLKSPKSENNSN